MGGKRRFLGRLTLGDGTGCRTEYLTVLQLPALWHSHGHSRTVRAAHRDFPLCRRLLSELLRDEEAAGSHPATAAHRSLRQMRG